MLHAIERAMFFTAMGLSFNATSPGQFVFQFLNYVVISTVTFQNVLAKNLGTFRRHRLKKKL